MQSPPARAEATSVHQRVAGVGPARGIAQAQVQGQGGREDQPGVGHQAVVVEGDTDAVRMVAW